MNTTRHAAQAAAVSDPTPATAGPVVSGPARKALAVLRIGFGLTFLWAFFDKLLALGFATGRTVDPATGAETVDRFGDAAWINGGSPTEGFLAFGAKGPFADFYHSIAGAAWADWLFMLGLLGIGTALTLGIGMRLGTAAGALLYGLMWTVVLPPPNNPLHRRPRPRSDHHGRPRPDRRGDHVGLGDLWNRTSLVRGNHWLR